MLLKPLYGDYHHFYYCKYSYYIILKLSNSNFNSNKNKGDKGITKKYLLCY